MKSTIHFEVTPFKETAICGTPQDAAPEARLLGGGGDPVYTKKRGKPIGGQNHGFLFTHIFFLFFIFLISNGRLE